MRDLLEEVVRATASNSRASALFNCLVRPGQKLCVLVWDSWAVKIEKPGNFKDQRATWSTKIHGNAFNRLEAVDLEGRPVFVLPPSASTSPRATDESMCFYILEAENVNGKRGGLTDILLGLPDLVMVHIVDNGFR